MQRTWQKEWFGNIRGDILAGLVVALAILIFMAQLPELTNVTWHVYALTAIDGSALSDTVADYAAWSANRMNTSLVLLNVLDDVRSSGTCYGK